MPATHRPHATATILSRRRSGLDEALSCGVVIGALSWACVGVSCSQRAIEHARPQFDDGDKVDEKHQNAERHRERNRAGAAAALLLVGQNNAWLARLFAHCDAHANTSLMQRLGRT